MIYLKKILQDLGSTATNGPFLKRIHDALNTSNLQLTGPYWKRIWDLIKTQNDTGPFVKRVSDELGATGTGPYVKRIADTGFGPGLAPFGGTYTWWANLNDAVFSNSAGTDYVDSVPLTGIADSLTQPTAANRPQYNATGLDSNVTMEATIADQKIYKGIDASVFNGGGTFAFVGLMNNIGGAKTFFTEATPTATFYNFQLIVSATNNLAIYTDADAPAITLDAFTYATFSVHHFTLSGTTFKYYKNGVLVSTIAITQPMTTARALTAFNYKSINAEQGYGELGDIVALTGTALNGTEIADDYTNFWKVKYPSLP